MNHSKKTEQLHTFTSVPRIAINQWHISGHSEWEATKKITVQVSAENDAIPAAIVTFIDKLHNAPYRTAADTELLKRFAGAMGLDYPNAPGLSS